MVQDIINRLDGLNGKSIHYTIDGTQMVATAYGEHGTVLSSTYSDGGFTGRGGKYDPAGVVHRGEYVLRKDQGRPITGRPKLSAITDAVADTGASPAPSNSYDISINVQGAIVTSSSRPA